MVIIRLFAENFFIALYPAHSNIQQTLVNLIKKFMDWTSHYLTKLIGLFVSNLSQFTVFLTGDVIKLINDKRKCCIKSN